MATEARTESTPRRTSGMGPGSPQSQPRGGRNPSGVGGIPHGKTSGRTWNGEGALEPSPGEIGRSGAGGGGSMQQAASVMPRAQHNTTTNMARAGLGGVGGGEGSTVQVYAARWSGQNVEQIPEGCHVSKTEGGEHLHSNRKGDGVSDATASVEDQGHRPGVPLGCSAGVYRVGVYSFHAQPLSYSLPVAPRGVWRVA